MSRPLRHTRKIAIAGIALVMLTGFPAGATNSEPASLEPADPAPANPEPRNPGSGRGGGDQDGDSGVVTVRATTTYLPVGSEGSSGDGCDLDSDTNLVVEDDFDIAITAGFFLMDPANNSINGDIVATVSEFTFTAGAGLPEDTRLFSPTGRWYRYNCGTHFYLLPEGGPAASIEGLVDQAVSSLDPPNPSLEVTPLHGKHLVRLPSWLAIEPGYWTEERRAIAVSGRVRVAATLTATDIEWDLGNGDTKTCDNPGVLWQDYMSEDQSTCSYTYTWPSINPPDNTYELAGTVSFDVSHQTNAPGVYGPWVPVERTATQTIQVVEIQAVSSPNP